MTTRRAFSLVACLLVSAPSALGADGASTKILGRWRSLETSRGGIGFMLDFGNDRVVNCSPGAVVEMTYRIEGNELVLPPGTTDGPEQRQTIKWLGDDRLRLREADAPDTELARKGSRSDTKNPIFVEWSAMRDMGGQKVETLYFFYPKGQSLLLIPFRWQRGSYSVNGGKIHLALPDRPPGDGAFKVEGNVLTLTLPDAHGTSDSRYARY